MKTYKVMILETNGEVKENEVKAKNPLEAIKKFVEILNLTFVGHKLDVNNIKETTFGYKIDDVMLDTVIWIRDKK